MNALESPPFKSVRPAATRTLCMKMGRRVERKRGGRGGERYDGALTAGILQPYSLAGGK
jgi:hypothetical protein